MSEADPQQEPSMEEILASIRRIISEDDKPEGEGETTETAEASDDVLELTDVAEEEPAEAEELAEAEEPAAEAAEEAPEAESADDAPEEPAEVEQASIDDALSGADGDDELELRDESADAPATPAPEPVAAAAPDPVDASLLEQQTTAAAVSNLSSLVAAVDRAHGGTTLGDGNRTIEDLVKEVMRPMVKEWLDANLPALTERIVRREVERLARYADED